MLRKIVKIDEEKCNGCGLCVPSCAEGAIQIIEGKARLVSDVYCDGLGACLGECPQGAISIEEREAQPFDEAAAHRHVARQRTAQERVSVREQPVVHACPSAAVRSFRTTSPAPGDGQGDRPGSAPSALTNWPVQLALAPLEAPYYDGASLLIASDCAPFALADFHRTLLAGNTLLVGCPKLDNAELYRRKLGQIFARNDIRAVTVAYMEVPCCFGLVHLVRQAIQDSGKDVPFTSVKIGIRGEVFAASSAEKARQGG